MIRWALAFSCITLLVACGDNRKLAADDDSNSPQCGDGIDNDGDGAVDYPADPGCSDPTDTTEDSTPTAKCSDGIDNDGDGKIDYPDDPGCSAANQDDETDDCPNGPHCPQCADGIDNDGNGAVDYPSDGGCMSASDNEEDTPNPNACGVGLTIEPLPVTPTTVTFDANSLSNVATACGGGHNAPAIAYEIHLSKPMVLTASTDDPTTTADTVLDLRSAMCSMDSAEIQCSDDIDVDTKASTIVASLPIGKYYLIVEGYDTSEIGKVFTLNVLLQAGEGASCTMTSDCGPGLVCRIPLNGSEKICTKPMCSDGVDDDFDTKADYPDDPGCESPDDNDELDTCPGAGCPACSDGADNDDDGMTDYPADTSCSSAAGTTESCNGEQDAVAVITGPSLDGTLVGTHDDHDPSCGGNGAPDRLYTLTIPALQSLTLDTEMSAVDTVLSLLPSTCSEPSVRCDDDGGVSSGASLLTVTNVAAGSYIVAVDAYSSTTTPDTFKLHVAGTLHPGDSCEAANTLGGAFTCPVTNPCEGATGSQICRPSTCNNGMDDDGDGKYDFPDDPGCTSIDDNDELDTCPGAGCPQCGDGVDNDGDGAIDYPDDTDCASASGSREGCDTEPVATIVAAATSGTTATGATNDYNPTCASTSGSGPDRVYRLDVPGLTQLSINLTTSYDSVHELIGANCNGAALACSDPTAMSAGALAAGTYYLVIDGYSATSKGTYTINLAGTIAPGESCEGVLAQAGALSCDATHACLGTSGARTCQVARCSNGTDDDGDGIADYPNDPGCDSPADDDELDTCPGVGCPACANGADDDVDGATDYAMDMSCWAASGTDEAFCGTEPDRALVIASPTTTGTTTGLHDNRSMESCQATSTGNDVALALVLPVPVATLSIDTNGSSYDTVLSLRDSTCATEVQCDDDGGDSVQSLITRTNVPAGTYAVYVDGYSTQSGAFAVHAHGTVANGTACTSPLFDTHVLSCTGAATCVAGTCQ